MARVFAVIFMACCVSAVAQEGVPHTFSDGEVIDAQKFNENFAKLKTLDQLRGLVEIIQEDCVIPQNDYPQLCVASCPTGKVATGGGCKTTQGSLVFSYPTTNTFVCQMNYFGALSAFATCL